MEIGKTYLIKHQRKGTFAGKITAIDDTWTDAIVTGGNTEAIRDYNVVEKGGTVRFRSEWVISAVEQPTQPTEEPQT